MNPNPRTTGGAYPASRRPGTRRLGIAALSVFAGYTLTACTLAGPSDPAPSPVGLRRTADGGYQVLLPRCAAQATLISVKVLSKDQVVWLATQPKDPHAQTIALGDQQQFGTATTLTPLTGDVTVVARTSTRFFGNTFHLAGVSTAINGGGVFDDADISVAELTALACD